MSVQGQPVEESSPEDWEEKRSNQDHLDLSQSSDSERRKHVTVRYQQELAERRTNPDKVFYDGENLSELDNNFVTLDSTAGENPRSWTYKKKWMVTWVVGLYCFLPAFTSTIFAPSLLLVQQDLGITNPTIGALQISMYLFAFSIGPLFFAPLTEIHGRKIVMQIGNVVASLFLLGGGFSQTAAQLAVTRFFGGLGGSAAFGALGGVLADMWGLKERAKASGLLTTAIVLAPVLAPVCGGWMSEGASWRWTMWIPAIMGFVLEGVAFFGLKECYAPKVLSEKLRERRKSTGNSNLYTVLELAEETSAKRGFSVVLAKSIRPVVYLLIDPALLLVCLYYGFVFAVFYLIIVTFPLIFGAGYGHSAGIVGTDFLGIGIGDFIGLFLTIKALHWSYNRQLRSGKPYNAGSRLIVAFPGTILLAAGLFMYGFSALKTHFIVPLIGVGICGCATVAIMLSIQVYLLDCFQFAASAVASANCVRFVLAGIFPLFGANMFDNIGVDWGMALLAFLCLGIGGPFLLLFYLRGKKLAEFGARNIRKIEGMSTDVDKAARK